MSTQKVFPMDQVEKIQKMQEAVDCSALTARNYLAKAGGELELAISLYLEEEKQAEALTQKEEPKEKVELSYLGQRDSKILSAASKRLTREGIKKQIRLFTALFIVFPISFVILAVVGYLTTSLIYITMIVLVIGVLFCLAMGIQYMGLKKQLAAMELLAKEYGASFQEEMIASVYFFECRRDIDQAREYLNSRRQ